MTNSVQVPIQISAYDIAQSLSIVYIVRDIAARDPYGTPLQNPPIIERRDKDHCAFCDEHRNDPHDPVCIWKRAREIVDSGVLDGKS